MTLPVAQGLFEHDEEGTALLATRCASCQALYFPRRATCRNPECRGKDVRDAALPRHGTLYSYTIQRYQPPPLFRMDEWQPYALGVIDLGHGVQVMGMLDGVALDEIAIGMPLRVTQRVLYRDEDGRTVHTYAFAPEDCAS